MLLISDAVAAVSDSTLVSLSVQEEEVVRSEVAGVGGVDGGAPPAVRYVMKVEDGYEEVSHHDDTRGV